jgi:hypothetical protein
MESPGNIFIETDFRNFVGSFKWTFAKTYAATAPHEYIALGKVGLEHLKGGYARPAT